MTLRVIREPSIGGTTVGVLFVDGRHFGFTLEDEIREVSGQPVFTWKVAGATAIPAGRYRLTLTESPRFGRVLPLLNDVPGFDGIRIHPGNTAGDTDGCVLVGKARAGAALQQSRAACDDLIAMMTAAMSRGESAWMLIENPLR